MWSVGVELFEKMDVLQVVNNQYAFPIGVVLICALLVFTFGFRAAEQPAFYRLTHTADDRKPAGKKRKLKDKKSQPNGHAASVGNDDHSENKQKTENSTTKTNTGKSASKQLKEIKNESPTKNISNKSQAKQQQKEKQGSSPVKENAQKSVTKEVAKPAAGKALKEKKETVESNPKLLKEKKQETTDKPVKEKNNNTNIQVKPTKGKENKVEEIKNKKNEKNLAKLKKLEEKPVDFDDGEWEQAVSRKDKKKKKDEDTINEKTVIEKKESGSPSKKKKVKTLDTVVVEALNVGELKSEKEDVKESKSSKSKDKLNEEKSATEKTTPVENISEVVVEKKSVEEVSASPDQSGKSKKKKKKSNKAAEQDLNGNDKAETLAGLESSLPTTPVKHAVSPKPVIVEIKENTIETKEAKSKSELLKVEEKEDGNNTIAFDELGDVWKEAKVPKKSKKKVRKDQ